MLCLLCTKPLPKALMTLEEKPEKPIRLMPYVIAWWSEQIFSVDLQAHVKTFDEALFRLVQSLGKSDSCDQPHLNYSSQNT